MVKILIIQLDRLGDTLWITPLLTELAQVKAPCRISVLIRHETAEALKGNPHVHEIITADWLNLPLDYPKIEGRVLLTCYQRLAHIVDDLKEKSFDYIYNMNFNKMTTVLTALIDAPQTIGFTISKDGGRLIRGSWVNYLPCVVKSRNYNDFNMVDIFHHFESGTTTARPLVFNISEEERKEVANFLKGSGIGRDDLLIGFQPGAMTSRKIWPPSHFAGLGDRLAGEMGAKILLFGVEHEAPLGYEIEKRMQRPVINLIGKTSIARLAAFLERCYCLVSNDTGTVHLAAAVGIKKIAGLFFGFANSVETPPYGEGHLIFQPNIPCGPCNWNEECREGNKCLDYLTPDGVFDVLRKWLNRPTIPAQLEDTEELKRMNIYYSLFDEFGFLTLFPLIKRQLRADDIMRLAYKLMWLHVLKGENDQEKRHKYVEKVLRHYPADRSDELFAKMDKTLQSLSELQSLPDRGVEMTRRLLDVLMQDRIDTVKINEITSRLNQVDKGIETRGTIHDELKPLTTAFLLDKQNLEGSNIYQLARGTPAIYEAAQLKCSLLRENLEEIRGSLIRFVEEMDNHPEAIALQPYCIGKGIDVGCGHRKTHPNCIGIDIIPTGEKGDVGCVAGKMCKADIQASGDNLDMFQDGELDYVVSRHNLEHYVDVVKTLNEWKRVLKPGGVLAVVLPDDANCNTISLDPTHKHAFTQESFQSLLNVIGGFKILKTGVVIPNWSFLCVAEKV